MARKVDYTGMSLSPQEGFLLSRIDGNTSVDMLAQLTGLNETYAIKIIQRLWELHLIEIDGVKRKKNNENQYAKTKTNTKKRGRTHIHPEIISPSWPIQIREISLNNNETIDVKIVSLSEQQVVSCFVKNLEKISYYELFQVKRNANRKEIRTAYFQLSKTFHPDHWFRKELGSFSRDVSTIFKWVNKAYATLSAQKKREQYEKILAKGLLGEWQEKQNIRAKKTRKNSPFEKLRKKAATAEHQRDFIGALNLFKQALQLRVDGEVLIHMAMCELQLRRPAYSIEILIARARGAQANETICLLLEAHLARRESKHKKALQLYHSVLKRDPTVADAIAGIKAIRNTK